MKKIAIAILVCLAPFISKAQAFNKYEDMKKVDVIIMTSKMFKMLAKINLSENDPKAQNFVKLIENLDELRMFTSGDAKIRSQMKTDVNEYLQQNSLEELMHVNEKNKNIQFYSKAGRNKNFVSELFMFMESEEEGEPMSVILDITGNIELSQLSQLGTNLNVPGAEELRHLEIKP